LKKLIRGNTTSKKEVKLLTEIKELLSDFLYQYHHYEGDKRNEKRK
jgi:hypothetical protein